MEFPRMEQAALAVDTYSLSENVIIIASLTTKRAFDSPAFKTPCGMYTVAATPLELCLPVVTQNPHHSLISLCVLMRELSLSHTDVLKSTRSLEMQRCKPRKVTRKRYILGYACFIVGKTLCRNLHLYLERQFDLTKTAG
jgi:hypothetical protein